MEHSIAFMLFIAICVAVFSTSFTDASDDESLTVTTSTATFRGKRMVVNPYLIPDFHGSVAAYTRIPYAEPPVGDLRFRRPVPGVVVGDFDATRESVKCPQVSSPIYEIGLEMSEDCLTLDVFVPEPKPSSAAVMVWIHGGGFVFGAGSIPRHLPTPLAAMNDVIVVTINYRVAILGFLGTGDEELPFNLGLLDQRQALVWVQANIAAFGGDPSRVTIFGESAGGMSVSYHVLSPMSAGLFSGAIMQSGTAHSDFYMTADDASNMAFRFGNVMNCSSTTSGQLAACLRKKTSDEFINYFKENPEAGFVEFRISPAIDGEFFPRDPLEMTANEEVNDVATMVGCLEEEMKAGLVPAFVGGEGIEKSSWDRATMDAMLSMQLGVKDEISLDAIALLYMSPEELLKSEPDYADPGTDCLADWLFLCPTFSFSSDLAMAGKHVYTYVITHDPPASMFDPSLTWLGSSHGEDLPYVLGSPFLKETDDNDTLVYGVFHEEDVEVSRQVMRYWSNFAKTGDPNLSSMDGSSESKYPAWPAFTTEAEEYKDISVTFQNQAGHPAPKRCHFHQNMLPKLKANEAEMASLKSLLEEKVSEDSQKSCDDPATCPED